MVSQRAADYVYGFGDQADILKVHGNLVCSGDIEGPTIEEIHKKIEDGQMTVDELEAAVHYIVNMELKHLALDVENAFVYAAGQIYSHSPSRVTEPDHILLEIDLMSNAVGNALTDAGTMIRTSFNNRLEKHGYNS